MARDPQSPSTGGAQEGAFATTHWSWVACARGGSQAEATEAMNRLCLAYWPPLYAFLRRRGYGVEDAQDLAQEFFAHLLARDFLQGLSRENGRFRAFLLASLRHFLCDQWDKRRALKRGGGQVTLALEIAEVEERYALASSTAPGPDECFERVWSMTLLDRAMDGLRDEYVAAGKAPLFEALCPLTGADPSEETGAEVAARFGMPENTFKSHLLRFRRRYRERIVEEVARTVAAPSDVAEELRHLKSALRH